jgi:hypothetical protein
VKENTETLLEASRDFGLEINAEKTMITSRQNSGQNQNIKTVNESFENVTKLKCVGTTLTNRNENHDEIMSRLNLENACWHSAQYVLSSRFTQKS